MNNPSSSFKKLWEEAEEEHRKDDDCLAAIYKITTDIHIRRLIELRWKEQGGRYVEDNNGHSVYRNFAEII